MGNNLNMGVMQINEKKLEIYQCHNLNMHPTLRITPNRSPVSFPNLLSISVSKKMRSGQLWPRKRPAVLWSGWAEVAAGAEMVVGKRAQVGKRGSTRRHPFLAYILSIQVFSFKDTHVPHVTVSPHEAGQEAEGRPLPWGRWATRHTWARPAPASLVPWGVGRRPCGLLPLSIYLKVVK